MNRALHVGLFSFPRLVHGGGYEEYVIALANLLTARGHRVCVVNASPHEYRALSVALNVYYRNPLLHDNSRTTTASVQARLGEAELFEVPVWRMARILRRCDVVYAKNELLDLSVLRVLRTGRLPPIICGVHTPLWYPRALSAQARLHNTLYLGRAYRVLLAGMTAVHVLNSYDAKLVPRVHGWSTDRVIHIPHWYMANGEERPSHASPDGPLRVFWGARMTEQKGVETLVDIIEALNSRPGADRYAFVIAGSGDPRLEAHVRSTAERFANVRYLGHMPHDEMLRLYDEADVALVTSNWETFGYSCLEPHSRGMPVVASDIPGLADIVEHNVTGFLFRPGDVAAAIAALTRIHELRNRFPEEFDAMRRRSLRRIHEHFEPTAITDALERMLLAVARNGRIGWAQ